jgi:hypothetical protein
MVKKIIILMFLSSICFAKNKQVQVDICDVPISKFKAKNLRDLDLMTRFMQLQTYYPWFQYHCNGVICTPEEFEGMCYLIKQAKKKKEDPNLINVGMLR